MQQKSVELSELLRDKAAAPDQIKARLTALRSAQEKARQELAPAQQNLRQILTLRQEALLVLKGLLDGVCRRRVYSMEARGTSRSTSWARV